MNIADWLERAGRSHGGSPAIAVAEEIVSDYRRLARRSAALGKILKTELRELDKRRPTRPASRTATEAI